MTLTPERVKEIRDIFDASIASGNKEIQFQFAFQRPSVYMAELRALLDVWEVAEAMMTAPTLDEQSDNWYALRKALGGEP